MKVKILTSNNYIQLEGYVNNFIQDNNIIDIKYSINSISIFSVLIMYK